MMGVCGPASCAAPPAEAPVAVVPPHERLVVTGGQSWSPEDTGAPRKAACMSEHPASSIAMQR